MNSENRVRRFTIHDLLFTILHSPFAMMDAREPLQLDTLLLPFVQEESEAQSESLLAALVTEHAEPIIRKVIKGKLRVTLNASDGSHENQDALEIEGEVHALLLAHMRSIKLEPDSKPIISFRSYVAGMSHNACSEYLRRKYPRRASLRNKLHYFLSHNSAFELWRGDEQQWLCGLTDHRSLQKRSISPDTLQQLRDMPQIFSRDSPTDVTGLDQTPGMIALVAFFRHMGGPVELDEAVTTFGELYGIRDQAPSREGESDDTKADALEQLPDTRVNVAGELEQRMYLQRLWGEVCQLPPRQRAALLLNLRDAHGRGIIALFPLLRIANMTQIAEALDTTPEKFAALWNELPLEDAAIAILIGGTRQQVINLRMCARKRLANRLKGF